MIIVTPTTLEAATRVEAKLYSRVESDYTAEDDVFDILIAAETEWVQRHCNLVLLSQTVRVKITPVGDVGVHIPTPANSISKIESYTDGVKTTLTPADYEIDVYSLPHSVRPVSGNWPDCDYILIELVVGYESGQLPKSIKHAILRRVADAYDNRSNLEATTYTDVSVILEPFRIPTI